MIDVVPLSEELSGENASTNPDNSENGSINVENAPIIMLQKSLQKDGGGLLASRMQ